MTDKTEPHEEQRDEEVEGHSPRYLQENEDSAPTAESEKVESDDEDDVGGHRMY